MSEFDITFELFTLLLGLAMAEVLAGYARVYKLRRRIRHQRAGELAVAGAASLAKGHAVTVEAHPPPDAPADPDTPVVRIGWLVPLSALVVICHQATFWLFMYEMDGRLPLNFLSLVLLLVTIGWYYLISAALWPDDPAAWPDFDEYYMAHRRFIWWGVIVIAIAAEQVYLTYGVELPSDGAPWMYTVYEYTNIAGSIALLAMPFIRSVRWATGVLVLIVAHFAITALLSPWIPV